MTVAAVLEQNGEFLLVEEKIDGKICYNQPAGHWECGESLIDAVTRETLEETAYSFVPDYLIGIYNWHNPDKNISFLRFTFGGTISGHQPERVLDTGIIAARWLSWSAIKACAAQHRSPMVLSGIEDYLAGKRYPLDLLTRYL